MIILYEQTDKSVAIVNYPEDVNVKHIIRSQIPNDVPYVLIDESDLPSEADLSEFGSALRVNWDNGNISFDISVAREITKNRLRKERIVFFEKNDIALRDAMLENNNDKISLAIAERDRLRNITQLVDTLNDLTELRHLNPRTQ